ncbi:MAG: FAD-dependent oxidoreductase [Candidatus Caldarchaeum sp.]
MAEKFDVVVVGAGPAGSAASLTLARNGYDVLMLEKTQLPGQRNVSGGVLFGGFTDGLGLIDLIPEFEEEAPLERKISGHELYLLRQPVRKNGDWEYRFVKFDKRSLLTKVGLTMLNASSGHDYTVLRARFDRWMASKAVEEGAMLATSKTVEDLIFKDGGVVGVVTQDEEIYADMVIDCGGVTSLLPEKAGIRPRLTPAQVYHGVKHVLKMSPQKIEEFFKLDDGFKTLYLLGPFMHGIVGGGFIYPNKDTLSVGIVVGLSSALPVFTRRFNELGKPFEILKEMMSHPFVSQILQEAKLVEYSAHNIPKGYKVLPEKPYAPGFLLAGDALGVFYKIGALIDGIRPAIASGILAARTFIHAKNQGDFSASTLSIYKKLLEPLYRLVSKSRTNSALIERKIFYSTGSEVMFKLGLGRKAAAKIANVENNGKDMMQTIQQMTGLLDYQEDKLRSHIEVNQAMASSDREKAWIPMCPVNCYTLVTGKGVFASFKDLYRYNLESLKKNGLDERTAAKKALETTLEDIRLGQLKFDHVACVACGTCGVIGPPSTVRFGHEWNGYGVKFRYG